MPGEGSISRRFHASGAAGGAKALEAAQPGHDKTTSVFIPRAAKHDVDLTDRSSNELPLEFTVVKNIKRKLRKGFELWKAADMPEALPDDAGPLQEVDDIGLRKIDTSEKNPFASVAWGYIELARLGSRNTLDTDGFTLFVAGFLRRVGLLTLDSEMWGFLKRTPKDTLGKIKR